MATKHEQILNYIEELEVGYKISVRQISKDLGVSEGTAYRAMKEAERMGLVSSIERVGTIRIEVKKKENIEKLTFAEVVKIVDGTVVGGEKGLHLMLNRFVIGAMKIEDMARYLDEYNLLIVGNRREAQELAFQKKSAVLLTGGFVADPDIIEIANRCNLPLISTSYDTFTVASICNAAIRERMVKKEVVVVEDILVPLDKTYYLKEEQTIADLLVLNNQSGHGHFPVVDYAGRVAGVVTSKDIIGQEVSTQIHDVMTKNPVTIGEKVTVAAAARLLIWESIDFLPVVNDHNELRGVVSRQDVLKAFHLDQKQPQISETVEDMILANFTESVDQGEESIYECTLSPQMANAMGTLSPGVCVSIMMEAVHRCVQKRRRGTYKIENTMTYYLKPIEIDSIITIRPNILALGRKSGKIEVDVLHNEKIVGKCLVSIQFLSR